MNFVGNSFARREPKEAIPHEIIILEIECAVPIICCFRDTIGKMLAVYISMQGYVFFSGR